MAMQAPGRHRGAALLMAMLTVALVATLAAGALWQQWRSVEIEASERNRVQAAWILNGALDWARLILREDARTGGADYLGEPWSVALSESRLSTFLAMDRNNTDIGEDVFLSGQITDAQARMNLRNLIDAGKVSEPDMQAFTRLYELLGLDPSELEPLSAKLRMALEAGIDPTLNDTGPLLPRRMEQVRWLGISAASLRQLEPYVTLLPSRSPLNLNTAGAEAIAASIAGLDLAGARRLVSERSQTPFRSLAQASRLLPAGIEALSPSHFSVTTRFFEVRGRLRMDSTLVEERSLVRRDGLDTLTLWRERVALDPGTVARTPP